jgi:exonuclease III
MMLRVVTWNMAHRVRLKKRAWDFLRYVIAPDLALVQEAHPPESFRDGAQFIYPENVTGTIGASGIWSRELPLDRVSLDTTLPNAIIASAISLPKGSAPLLVISMYGTFDRTSHVTPNLHRMISDLHSLITDKAYKGKIMIGGDWNIDRSYNKINPGSAPLHRLVFERLEDEFYGLQRCNKEPLRTIRHRSIHSYQDDYIYVSKKLIPKLVSCDVVNDPEVEKLSDHLPVVAVFEL